MKKFSFLIAIAFFIGAIAFSPVKAQDEKQAEFERTWYDTCYTKKDVEKCYQQSKELVATYPKSAYFANAQKIVKIKDENDALTKANDRFQAALKAYYAGPDANKLEQLFSAGDDALKVLPGNQYIIGQVALAGAHGSIGQIYKNYDRVKGYGEQALKAFEPAAAPEGWEKANWDSFRELIPAQINQFLGFRLIETKGDKDQSIAYLTKATQIKNKDGAGWKDANNYWLRVNIYRDQYVDLSMKYNALPDDQKTGDAGKALLKQINEVIDTYLIPDYARLLATATKPELKEVRDEAKKQFDLLWKFRTDAPAKAAEFVKTFDADPTVASPPIPVKAETENSSVEMPAGGAGASNVKLSSSNPNSSAGTASTSNGKAAPAKKAPAKRRKP